MYWNKRVVQEAALAASLHIDNVLVSNCYTAVHYCYYCYCYSLICLHYCTQAVIDVIECYCILVAVDDLLQQLMFVGALSCCCTAMADYLVDSAENYLMYHFDIN